MKKGAIILVIFSLALVFLTAGASAIFVGITDGYVKDVNGSIIDGANVTVSVTGCSGGGTNGCIGNVLSGSNGYYIVNNLNLPKNGGVSVSAFLGTGTGSASGTADSFQIAHVNVSICYAPSTPTLTAVPDSHNTTVNFSWTSGSDHWGRAIHDKFDIDGSVTDPATSPLQRILGFATHTWKAATCNNYCCSAWASDVFVLGNQPPSAPNNTNHTSSGTTTTLNWTSGVDPDGDPVYDEFQYANGSVVSGLTPPYDVTTQLLIRWAVRTCDSVSCSNWTWTDTVTCSNATSSSCQTCPECETCDKTCGGSSGSKWTGGGAGCRKVAMTCNGIPIGEETLLSLNLQLGPNGKKITISGVNLTLDNLEYCPWCYNGIKDYDESGVDCGGSCKDCSEAEVPMPSDRVKDWTVAITTAAIVSLLSALGWLAQKFKVIKHVISIFN